MPSKMQLATWRVKFRHYVFERDGHRCVLCKAPAVDAHHITDRNEIPNGGYVEENGISLCEACHRLAELYHQTGGTIWPVGHDPRSLYKAIGSSREEAHRKAEELT